MRLKPIGFVAICQCKKTIGAMDFERTGGKEASRILSDWLMRGCIVEPRFQHNWSVMVENCTCNADPSP